MGFLGNLFNPLWSKASKLPESKQITFGLVIATYDFIRWTIKDAFMGILEKSANRGIIDKYGKSICLSSINEDQQRGLINNMALGILRSCFIPDEDPSKRISHISPSRLVEFLMILFQNDENYRTGIKTSLYPGDSIYSKKSDEARAQVLVNWMKILNVSDPEFPRFLGLAGFANMWDEFNQSIITTAMKGFSNMDDKEIIVRTMKDCGNVPEHQQSFYEELINRMNQPGFNRTQTVLRQREVPSDIFSNVVRVQGTDKMDLYKGGTPLSLMASSLYCMIDDPFLSTQEKLIFSRWANLPISYWGDEHKKEFVIAEIHFLANAKRNGINISAKILEAGEDLLSNEDLPSLPRPLSPELISIFVNIWSAQSKPSSD